MLLGLLLLPLLALFVGHLAAIAPAAAITAPAAGTLCSASFLHLRAHLFELLLLVVGNDDVGLNIFAHSELQFAAPASALPPELAAATPTLSAPLAATLSACLGNRESDAREQRHEYDHAIHNNFHLKRFLVNRPEQMPRSD